MRVPDLGTLAEQRVRLVEEQHPVDTGGLVEDALEVLLGLRPTVPVADGDPGVELQVDFGRLGLVPDPARGTRRVAHGLIFTAVYSRHLFVFPTHRQNLEEVIAGFDAAWAFFGGVFAVVVPDNLKPVVDRAEPLDPRFNDAFREYAQARGFVIDPPGSAIRRTRLGPRCV